MKTLKESINNKLFESILDDDEKAIENVYNHAIIDSIKKYMHYASSGKCEYNKDYIIDEDLKVHIIGFCPALVIDKNMPKNMSIITIEPRSVSIMKVKDISKLPQLPSVYGNLGYIGFTLVICDKQHDITTADLSHIQFVHGNLSFSNCKSVDLSIIPNCSNELSISEKTISKIKYPAGFPSSTKNIMIYKL